MNFLGLEFMRQYISTNTDAERRKTMATTPHKHAEIIKAWADNPALEVEWSFDDVEGIWHPLKNETPTWDRFLKYRIKPEPPAKVYPETRMEDHELKGPFAGFVVHADIGRAIANAALRHAIDIEQVVPMAEVLDMSRELNKRHRAARDMAVAKAVLERCKRNFNAAKSITPNFDFDLAAIIAQVPA